MTTASNGDEALQLLETLKVDLVITDIIMPERDGLETIVNLLQKPEHPKIIAISGGSQKLDPQLMLATAKHLRVDAVLSKPITRKALKSTIPTSPPSNNPPKLRHKR